ncbi:MAG: hypothetical protein R2762_12765 [Bryobacteraceae bacterium]
MDRNNIEEHLEDYLRGSLDPRAAAEFDKALAADEATHAMVKQFQAQSELLRALRPPASLAPEDLEPAPGFYARVLERVEQQRSTSIWTVFAEPHFFRRLAFASGALLVLLGVVMATAEPEAPVFAEQQQIVSPEMELAREPEPVLDVTSVTSGDRARILVDLTTYEQ